MREIVMKPYIFQLIEQEQQRQEHCINLIASENYASKAILQATGSVLTNKYAEGYPGKRYYGGCEIVDKIEAYAIEQGKKLFNAGHMNVQPHSGSSANFAVYASLLKPGDTILAMSLSAGGHLTHGYSTNFSGRFYNFIHYGVNKETECIDYNEIEKLAHQHKPAMIVAGASAYARHIDYQRLNTIAQSVKAYLFIDMAHIAGLVAGNVVPSPMPWADVVSSTTHKTLRGPRGGIICCKEAIGKQVDKAIIPGSQGGPLMHVIAAKAVCFEEALQPSFKTYAQQILLNAQAMVSTFKDLGYRIVSGGTDTHLFLIDLPQSKNTQGLTGKEAETILGQCNIIINRNTIPFDPQPPTLCSGIRIGTPAITTRGFKEKEAKQVAEWIDTALHTKDKTVLTAIKNDVGLLCKQFPVYSNMPRSNDSRYPTNASL